MRTNTLLVVLVVVGSVLCWWPLILEPTLDLPWQVPLTIVALSAGLATILSGGRWLRFVAAATAATSAGLFAGYMLWPMEDGIAQSYAGIAVIVATLAVALVTLVSGLVGRKISIPNGNRRRPIWIVLICCVAFGPVALGLRPSLIAHRVTRNDRVAAERFEALKLAVERTKSEADNPRHICDGQALKRNYSGPTFGEEDWRYIAGNYVKRDGYIFGIWIDCSQPGHYTIDARPARRKADGTRKFCTDESGKVGCGMDWTGSRYACPPCSPAP